MTDKDEAAPQGNEDAAARMDAAAAEQDWLAVIAAPTGETPEAGAVAGNDAGPADSPAPAGVDSDEPEAGQDPSRAVQARRSAPAWLAGIETAEDSVPAEVQAKRDRMAELSGQAEQLERAAKARLASQGRKAPAGSRNAVAAGLFGRPGASAVAEADRPEDRADEPEAAEPRAVEPPAEASSPDLFAPLASEPGGPGLSGAASAAPGEPAAEPGEPFEPDGQADPAPTASAKHAADEPGEPAMDAGEAAPQAPRTDGRDDAAGPLRGPLCRHPERGTRLQPSEYAAQCRKGPRHPWIRPRAFDLS